MKALLIINQRNNSEMRIIVNLQTKSLKDKVASLLQADKELEAFKLLVQKAEVEFCLPAKQKVYRDADMTLRGNLSY